jgi:hypothetical protein
MPSKAPLDVAQLSRLRTRAGGWLERLMETTMPSRRRAGASQGGIARDDVGLRRPPEE